MVRVKICGMRSRHDAIWTASAGAWAAGFIFAPSQRQVTVDEAAQIIQVLPLSIHKVGVFVDSAIKTVKEIISATGIDMLQFHGQESPEYCQEFDLPVIKSFRVRDENSLADVEKYPVYAHLFDTYVPGSAGGSGISFDWRYLDVLPRNMRIMLAGGLTPRNVAEAIERLNPFAVDVSSGVEIAGRKDRNLINEFVGQVRDHTRRNLIE